MKWKDEETIRKIKRFTKREIEKVVGEEVKENLSVTVYIYTLRTVKPSRYVSIGDAILKEKDNARVFIIKYAGENQDTLEVMEILSKEST